MVTHASPTSRRRFPRHLGVILMFPLIVPAVTSTTLVAAENEATASEPPAKISINAPQPERLARGVVLIQYRTENLQILPVFGPAALAVSPRIGHLHVTLDEGPLRWAHTSGEPLIISGLTPGPHKVLIEAVNANHQPLAQSVVKFEVRKPSLAQPDTKAGGHNTAPKSPEHVPAAHESHGSAAGVPAAEQPPAKIIVDPPQPRLLAKGVVFINYRTEHAQIAPVFGPAAVAISPRVGHLHVTVDEAPWRWADASGGPVIVNGLPPGPHKIVIELADANHQPLATEVVNFEVPQR
jgi:Family of unknown function (DUF6130)